jgi:hypothetical protein
MRRVRIETNRPSCASSAPDPAAARLDRKAHPLRELSQNAPPSEPDHNNEGATPQGSLTRRDRQR